MIEFDEGCSGCWLSVIRVLILVQDELVLRAGIRDFEVLKNKKTYPF